MAPITCNGVSAASAARKRAPGEGWLMIAPAAETPILVQCAALVGTRGGCLLIVRRRRKQLESIPRSRPMSAGFNGMKRKSGVVVHGCAGQVRQRAVKHGEHRRQPPGIGAGV